MRARASPTGPRRSDVKLDAKSAFSGAVSEAGSSICGDNDPEDLTIAHQRYGGFELSPPLYQSNFKHHNRFNSSGQAVAAKSIDSLVHNLSKEPYPAPLAPPVSGGNSTGSPLLDTYIQMISESSPLSMNMMSEAAVHAAKFAQLNAMGGLDKASQQHIFEKMQQHLQNASEMMIMKRSDEIRRGENDIVNHDREKEHEEGETSGGEEEEYSEDEAEPETVKAGD